MRNQIEERYAAGELIGEQSESSRALRARMSQPGPGDAGPGMGSMHQHAERLLAGASSVELDNGFTVSRTADGGVSIKMRRPTAQRVEPVAVPEVTPAVTPKPTLADPFNPTRARLGLPPAAPAVPPPPPRPSALDRLAEFKLPAFPTYPDSP